MNDWACLVLKVLLSFDSPCYHQKFVFAFSTTKFGVVLSFIFIFSCDYGVNVFLPLDKCAPEFFSWVAPQLCTFPFSMHFPWISFTFCMAVTSALHFRMKVMLNGLLLICSSWRSCGSGIHQGLQLHLHIIFSLSGR